MILDYDPAEESDPLNRFTFSIEGGVEVIVEGDEPRRLLAQEVVEKLQLLSARATRMLIHFRSDPGTFQLEGLTVLATRSPEVGDFSFRYSFQADTNSVQSDSYGFTYFEVHFDSDQLQLPVPWPMNYTVGHG